MKINLLALAALILVIGCKKDKETPGPVDPPVVVPTDIIKKENERLAAVVTSTTTETFLSGMVKDEDGKPLAGVSVNAGSTNVTTNEKGVFQFPSKLALNKDYATLSASLTGYFKAFKTFTPNTSGKANQYIELTLLKATSEKTVAATGGNVILDNKINLTFPDAAVVTSTGAAYTGQYKVSARYIDPNATNFLDIMPGILAGLNDKNEMRALQSFGMANVELKDMSGNPLQIAPGKTVKMVLPASSSAPATIPLWHFNEKYGLWIQAGTSTKSGDTYTAEVNHFSIWNLDMEVNAFKLDLEFKNDQGKTLAGLKVFAQTSAGNKLTSFVTDNEGKVTLISAPASQSLILKVVFDCDTIAKTLAPVTADRTESVIISNLPSSIKTYSISGKITGCDDLPLVNYPFQLSVQGSPKILAGVTDAQGLYNFSTSFCNPLNTVSLQAFSFINNQYLFSPAITSSDLNLTYNARICDSLASVSDNFVVVFPDPNLNSIVRQVIGKPSGDILYGDTKNIDSIVRLAWDSSRLIKSLEGVQFCTNLRSLRIITIDLTNLSPLQNLKGLKVLEFQAAELSKPLIDIAPLKNLLQLEELSLTETQIADISALTNLNSLKKLSIYKSLFTDISPLKNSTNLESLSLTLGKLADLSALKDLKGLKSLTLDGNQITNLTPLQDLLDLEQLTFSYNQVTSLAALGKMTKIKILTASNNTINSIDALKNCTLVTNISLGRNQISDLTSLQNLGQLKYLHLSYNKITDITPLIAGVPAIAILQLGSQSTGVLPQSQKDAFKTAHPTCSVGWD